MFHLLPQAPYPIVHHVHHPRFIDDEDAYVERKRREYLAALQHQQRRSYEQAVAAEEQRHRARIAALAQQERERIHRCAAHRQSLPPYAFTGACAPTNIVRGRYNRQRDPPHFQPSTSVPAPQPPRAQSEEITLDQLLSQLFGHSVHHESDAEARKPTQPTALPHQQAPRSNSTTAPVASTSTAPAPAQAPPSAPAEAEPTEGHWMNAVKRTRSVAAISQVSRTFDSLKRTFTFPAGPLAPIPGSEAPRLAYNPTTAPIHAYEHALSELLTKLDAVDSFGFRGVRELRKEVVVKIEKELEALEKRVAEAIAAGASPVIKTTEVASEEPATEKQAEVKDNAAVEDKVTEDTVMEEAEVAVLVVPGDAEETVEGYDVDTDDTTTVVPAHAPAPATVEPTLIADSPMVDSETQTVAVEVAQPEVSTIASDATPAEPTPVGTTPATPSPTRPMENAIELEYGNVGPHPITMEPASQVASESITPSEVVLSETVANPIHEPLPQAVLDDATASSSESESEIEDAVDVTVSSESDVEVVLEAADATSDAEKDFEML